MIELDERPKNPIIIEGFPGLGFVSTIATEFLIKHLNAKRIGRFFSNKLAPMVAIHKSDIIDPLEIYYDKKHNIVIVRALTNINEAEWEIGEIVMKLAEELKAKEIISLEGVMAEKPEGISKVGSKVYYFSTKKNEKLEKFKIETLKDGIVIGVTGVLILKLKKIPLSCIFVETHSALPDSRAAADLIKVLDSYLNLKVDYKPLVKTAEEFEGKLKEITTMTQKTSELKKTKEASYLG